MKHIFLSYSSKDIDFATVLERELEHNDYVVWRDQSELRGGQQWKQMIEAALMDAWAIIVVQSSHSKLSRWVTEEVEYAAQLRRPIIPLLLDGEPWFGFLGSQHIDLRLHNRAFVPDSVYRALLPLAPHPSLENEIDIELLSGNVPERLALIPQLEQIALRVRSPKSEAAKQLLFRLTQDSDVYIRHNAEFALERVKNAPTLFLERSITETPEPAQPHHVETVPPAEVISNSLVRKTTNKRHNVVFLILLVCLLLVVLAIGLLQLQQVPTTLDANILITPTVLNGFIGEETMTFSPSQEAETNILLETDFEQTAINGLSVEWGNWSIVNQDENSFLRGTGNAIFGEETWEDYAVQARIRITGASAAQTDMVLTIRENPRTRVGYETLLDTVSGIAIAKDSMVINGVAIEIKEDEWYTVVLEAQDNVIRVYLNDALIVNMFHSELKKGFVEMNVGAGGIVDFDDIKIWSL